jgi:predicted ATPase
MRNLNVLSGINSTGKSTIIQALLLLRQAYEMGTINDGLRLNGDIVNVGTGKDLLCRSGSSDIIGITLAFGGVKYDWSYKYSPTGDYLHINESNVLEKHLRDINLFAPTFSYVSAERLGPQRIYNKSGHQVHERNQVGFKGEYFVDYLAERGIKDKVTNDFIIKEGFANTLISQMEAWLSLVSPGIKLNTDSTLSEAGLVQLFFVTNDGGMPSNNSPINVGFGLSYTAPVILALLKAKPGDLVILENPEAHLHPKGQRKMGELIAGVAKGGVQVIVETHSDHLLNGIRMAVKNGQISNDDVCLNYFFSETRDNKLTHSYSAPQIRDDGSLDRWPEGFFDEWDNATMELF